ncbi:hypothetical protein PanWU01x14_154620, partial [Parasponia andersonii]
NSIVPVVVWVLFLCFTFSKVAKGFFICKSRKLLTPLSIFFLTLFFLALFKFQPVENFSSFVLLFCGPQFLRKFSKFGC